ncbi:hypothetical protein ACF09C_22560 [Streptomyces sp. NPDC014870]|uniref:hypothetical protein n=1 Tax=Streptomyces sp. NPDC014870 TaxID=3364925 RepID=UPI0036FB9BD4
MSDVTDAEPEVDTAATAESPGGEGPEAGTGDDMGFEPVGPAPLGVERVPTGRPGVDALLDRLSDADRLPADGHLEVYEDVHRGLRDELTSLDAVRSGPTPGFGPTPGSGPAPGPGPTPPTSSSSYDPRS